MDFRYEKCGVSKLFAKKSVKILGFSLIRVYVRRKQSKEQKKKHFFIFPMGEIYTFCVIATENNN
jgi:hypothetical protein